MSLRGDIVLLHEFSLAMPFEVLSNAQSAVYSSVSNIIYFHISINKRTGTGAVDGRECCELAYSLRAPLIKLPPARDATIYQKIIHILGQ